MSTPVDIDALVRDGLGEAGYRQWRAMLDAVFLPEFEYALALACVPGQPIGYWF